ncbi:MAG: HD domain-containing protein, partial [Cyanobacteria bacterium]|nr:HD domain-containing protein [Cyanobacteriota bacterium]
MSETKTQFWQTFCPRPPQWRLEWQQKFEHLDWVEPMIGCKQDPIHHAEGDVATHVRLVCEALAKMDEWRNLDAQNRTTVMLAAAMHDVAKPACTVIGEDGRITSPGHGKKGAQMARQILWRGDGFADEPPPLTVREAVSAMVRFSSLPLWLW